MKIGLLSIFKFLLALVLLPAVIAVTTAFQNELASLKALEETFYLGVIAYVVMHLFIFTPVGFFQFGQKIFGELFKFSAIASSVVPMVIPLLTTSILLVFYLLKPAVKNHAFDSQIVFAVGFTLAMHIVLVAHQLYDEDSNGIKPNYLCSMILIAIVNLCLVAALLDLCFDNFSASAFLESSWKLMSKMYHVFYHKFLLLKKA